MCPLTFVNINSPIKLYRSIKLYSFLISFNPQLSLRIEILQITAKFNFADALLPIQPNCQRSNLNRFRGPVELLTKP